ncbi:MAG: family 78 glycoside hydrolase catalytic domain, partial [Bacteroidaceae bacterium]|nr:family 78 glycoside hydrolase catalytic domain [Bacteroidaceae bacterium]
TSFKQQDFKDAWKDVDTLGTKSIEILKSFPLSQSSENISNAVIYISGLGHYILNINGKKVSDAEFSPLWTDYNKTVYYNLYDITSLLRSTSADINLCALLGNGMYNVQRDGRYAKFQASYGAPKLFFQLIVNYKDGTQQVVKTDGTEHYRLSNITFNSIYGGESASFPSDNQPLSSVAIVEPPLGKLLPQTAPPVKIMEKHNVKSWHYADTAHTVIICDMGQNLAGFPEITYSNLTAGNTIKLTVAEKLSKDGLCDQKQTGRPYYYSIVANTSPHLSPRGKGRGGVFCWHPHFSYYGFRFIQVEGAVMQGEPNPHNLPVIEKLQSCFVHNSAEEYSAFESSNQLFTDTHRLIERAERSNMQSIFTDCPHREKLGWLEQDHLCGKSLLYNYNLTTFAPKIIRDICDAQKPNGAVPTIAPQYVEFGNKWGDFDESPEWGSTLIILPFLYYEHYGDASLIRNNFDAMYRYVDYLTSRADNGIINFGLGDWYDYQDNAPAGFSKNTPVALVATAHYIYDLQLLLRASSIVNSQKSKAKYAKLLKETINSFNAKFFNADSCYYGNNSQCSNALPLFLGICPEGTEEKVYQHLIADVM